ncbi:hypothetical protein B0H13DRAFT_1924008 [Mycena leptocephala]|nr:hypothetical protein B0H13DRAFT_1924008 [Mycena leptocephala]
MHMSRILEEYASRRKWMTREKGEMRGESSTLGKRKEGRKKEGKGEGEEGKGGEERRHASSARLERRVSLRLRGAREGKGGEQERGEQDQGEGKEERAAKSGGSTSVRRASRLHAGRNPERETEARSSR